MEWFLSYVPWPMINPTGRSFSAEAASLATFPVKPFAVF
jgi:hypothetical protein